MKKSIIPSIVLYIFAVLLAVFAVWGFIRGTKIISEAVNAGQLIVGESLYDIVGFYMVNCAQYFVYALLMAAAGLILQRQRPVPCGAASSELPGDVACDSEPDGEPDEAESEDNAEPEDDAYMEDCAAPDDSTDDSSESENR